MLVDLGENIQADRPGLIITIDAADADHIEFAAGEGLESASLEGHPLDAERGLMLLGGFNGRLGKVDRGHMSVPFQQAQVAAGAAADFEAGVIVPNLVDEQ